MFKIKFILYIISLEFSVFNNKYLKNRVLIVSYKMQKFKLERFHKKMKIIKYLKRPSGTTCRTTVFFFLYQIRNTNDSKSCIPIDTEFQFI